MGGGAISVIAICGVCYYFRSSIKRLWVRLCGGSSTATSNSAAVRQSIYEDLCRRAQPTVSVVVQINEAEANRMSLSYFDPKTRSSDGRVPSENWARWVTNHISINFPAEHQQKAIDELTAPPLNYNDNVRSYRIEGRIVDGEDGKHNFHMGALAAYRLGDGDIQYLSWMYSESFKLKGGPQSKEAMDNLENYLRQKAVQYFEEYHSVP